MRQANKAISERRLTPTIKQIIKALNGATVFRLLDLNQGYNRLEASATAYFDPDKRTEILVDASPVGLGAILCQLDPHTDEGKSLTATEQRYSQTEREALAIVWSEYFHLYVYGKPITVFTDHKPLVHIYSNPTAKTSARLERWSLRLQPYQVTVAYRKGADNPADYMSRHPAKNTKSSSRQDKVAEEFVDYLAKTSTPKAINIHEIIAATRQDPTLQAVTKAMDKGVWFKFSKEPCIDTDIYKAMEKVKHELTLSTTHGIILKGTRRVMPTTLQQRVIDLAQEGHQGIVKTKKLLREKVWFHRMNDMVEKKTTSCGACQIATPRTTREPLQMSPLPASPWRELDKTFSTFGIPEIVRSDNGPPFNGREFREFAQTLGFKHRKVTPLWPRANGQVERFMRTIKKSVAAAKADGKPWKTELFQLLRNYRSTPHSSTGIAPATALFNRPMRNELPEVPQPIDNSTDIAQGDHQPKIKMKAYADNTVVVKRDPSTKKSLSPYMPEPYTVTERKGSMITAKSGDAVTTRNSSFFKQIPRNTLSPPDNSSDGDDDSPTTPSEEALKDQRNKNQAFHPEVISTRGRRYPKRNSTAKKAE
ncbi:Uncharacterized protein P5673_026817 [Acropora cervicornis]|uniref:Integrase catalytic domain-containing protein n=1 Tax=Acropora cervicornis TaxID=6130 RepID=A0AAD9PZR3_ACRCE|nr:Uncharacterized protein P5673_026817 [Acropora cervicornis]